MRTISLIILALGLNTLPGARAQNSVNHSNDVVVELDFQVSEDSSASPLPIRDGIEFVYVNNHPIKIWIDQNSINYSAIKKPLSCNTYGYVENTQLKTGMNAISMSFNLVDFKDESVSVPLTSGSHHTTLLAYPFGSKVAARQLCSVSLVLGQDGGNCSGTYKVALKELSPGDAAFIEEMLRYIRQYADWFKLISYQDFAVLDNFYNLNKNADLDNFDIGALVGNPEYADIVDIYQSRRRDVQQLQQQLSQQSAAIKTELNANYATLTEELKKDNIDINDPRILDPINLGSVASLPASNDNQSDGSSPLAEMYANVASNAIQQMKASYASGDRSLLLRQIASWEHAYFDFDQSLATAKSPAPQDILALQNAAKMVDAYLYGYLKGYGNQPCVVDLKLWFCDTSIPQDIKDIATNQFAKAGPAGEHLSKALKTMNPQKFSSAQAQAYYDSLRIIAKMLERVLTTYHTLYDAAKEDQERLNRQMEEAAAATRTGIKCGAIAIAAGDFGDLYEAVAGVDLCTGETLSDTQRLLTLGGVVILDGRVWRGLGEAVELTPVTRKLAKRVDEIIEYAKDEFKISSPIGLKLMLRIDSVLASLPAKLKVQRIFVGNDTQKIAVIGRSMEGCVDEVVKHFERNGIKVERFVWSEEVQREFNATVAAYRKEIGKANDLKILLPYDRVKNTVAYQKNKMWIEALKEKGFSILDMGDPLNMEASLGKSAFYDLEKIIVFGDKV